MQLSNTIKGLMRAYEERNPGWGNLHIVMDDGNLEDSHLDWCVKFAKEEKDWDGYWIAMAIRELTEEERSELYNKWPLI